MTDGIDARGEDRECVEAARGAATDMAALAAAVVRAAEQWYLDAPCGADDLMDAVAALRSARRRAEGV